MPSVRNIIKGFSLKKLILFLFLLTIVFASYITFHKLFPELLTKGRRIDISISGSNNKVVKDYKFTQRLTEVCGDEINLINIELIDYTGNPTQFPFKVSNDALEYEYNFRFLEADNIYLIIGLNKEKLKYNNSLDTLNHDIANILFAACLLKKELTLERSSIFDQTVFKNFPKYLNEVLVQESGNKYSLLEL